MKMGSRARTPSGLEATARKVGCGSEAGAEGSALRTVSPWWVVAGSLKTPTYWLAEGGNRTEFDGDGAFERGGKKSISGLGRT